MQWRAKWIAAPLRTTSGASTGRLVGKIPPGEEPEVIAGDSHIPCVPYAIQVTDVLRLF
ncbi:hypothetical protein Kisp01_29190 [Kineosporia sp. NBRC 101677]|nr:hypothetical protein Kisp01_29190 [Kineosporia sp. NBRC 101677]